MSERGEKLRQCRDLALRIRDCARIIKRAAPRLPLISGTVKALLSHAAWLEGTFADAMSKAGECPERDYGGHIWLDDGTCDYCGERR